MRGKVLDPRFAVTLKFSRRILLACLLCALVPLGLAAALTLWREPGLRLVFGLALGFALPLGFAAAYFLNRELRRRLGSLRAALEQVSPGGNAPPAHDELIELLAEATRRLSELAALRETTLALTGPLEAPRLLQTIVERAAALLGVSGGFAHEIESGRRKLHLRAAVGRRADAVGSTIEFGEDAAGHVAETGQSLVVHDYAQWEGRSPQWTGAPLFNLLAVPMRWRGELIGVLSLVDEVGGRRFDARDVALAEQFARPSAAALGNARLLAAANRQAERLSILHQASQAVSRSLELDQIYTTIHQAVGQLIPSESLAIGLLDEAEEFLEGVYFVDRGERLPPQRQPVKVGLAGHVLRERRPCLFQAASERPNGMAPFGEDETVQSILAVPLSVGGHVFGVLAAQSHQPNAFTEDDVPLLTTLANHAAAAIRNGRLFLAVQQQLAQLSILHAVAQAAVSGSDLSQAIQRALQTLRRRANYECLSVHLLNAEGAALKRFALVTALEAEIPGDEIPLGRGAAGRAAQTGRALRLPDVDQPIFPGARSALCVPLKAGQRMIGVLNAEATAPSAFDEADERLLTIVAGLLAPIIENAELVERDRKRLDELSLLYDVALAAVSAPGFDDLISQALQVIRRRLDYETVGVALVDETGEWLMTHPSYLGVDDPGYLAPIPITAGIVGAVIRTGQTIRVGDVSGDPRFRQNIPGVQSQLAVPLKVADRVIGVINTESRRLQAYTEGDERLLTVVAGLLAPIIENARLRARAEQQAHDLDLLTRVQATAASSLDLEAMLPAMVEQVGRALDVTSAYVVEQHDAYEMTAAEYYGPEASALERVSDLRAPYPLTLFTLAARAIRENRPIQTSVDDPEASEREREHLRQFGGRAALFVPLKGRDHALGYLEFWDTRRDRVFTARELQLAQTLAGSVAAALENARLYQAARRQAEQMRLVNEVGRDIAAILDLPTLVAQVSQRLESAFGYYHAKVGLVEGDEIVFPARHDAQGAALFPEVRLPLNGPGLNAWVVRHSAPRLVPDVLADPDFLPNALYPNTRAEVCVPLIAGGRTIGVLDVQSTRVGGLSRDDLNTLEAVSGQLAVAIENARLFAEARQRAEEVSALLATTLDLNSTVELATRLLAITRVARRLAEADSCILYKLDPEGERLRPIAVDDKYAEEMSRLTIAVGEGVTGLAVLTGKGELINRVDLDPRSKPVPGLPDNPENLIVAPLRVGGRITGVMAVYREGLRGFKPHDLNLISSFAAQAAVAIENQDLYQSLIERANSLQAAYNELAEMDRRKDEMAQNISHELRTPLTFLKSYVDLLIAGDMGALNPEQERSLRIVADKTQALVRLVNDILTLQAVTPETIKRLPLDLTSLARAAADGIRAAAQAAGLVLYTHLPDAPVMVEGDPLRLTQVFDNLLGNAMKFTYSGGEIHLSVRPGEKEVRVEVRDTGVGIAPENLEKVFNRFYQVDGAGAPRRGGVGLGLSICRLIVEAHGGRIGAESQIGAGSSFYFVLPTDGAAKKEK
jgi:GAF domain-containing protein